MKRVKHELENLTKALKEIERLENEVYTVESMTFGEFKQNALNERNEWANIELAALCLVCYARQQQAAINDNIL